MQQSPVAKSPGVWWRQQEARYRFREALILARKGQYGGAIARMTRALYNHPQPSTVLTARGLLHLKQGDLQSALDDVDQAIALNPSNSKAYGNRGLIRAQLGDEDGALEDWGTALIHRPCYAEASYNRGLLYANQKDYATALVEFDQALDANPNLAEAYFHRGNVRHELGDRHGATKDWQLALLNDLSLDSAKRHLLQQRRETRRQHLTQSLQERLNQLDPDITIEAERQGMFLDLQIHRTRGTAINYPQLAEQLRDHLIQLNIGIEQFRIIGRMGDGGLPDWNRVYHLYENQPCPPARWKLALLSTFLLCPPFGVIAMVYAAQVSILYNQGRYRAAVGASKMVKWYFWLSLGLFSLVMLIVVGYGLWLLFQ